MSLARGHRDKCRSRRHAGRGEAAERLTARDLVRQDRDEAERATGAGAAEGDGDHENPQGAPLDVADLPAGDRILAPQRHRLVARGGPGGTGRCLGPLGRLRHVTRLGARARRSGVRDAVDPPAQDPVSHPGRVPAVQWSEPPAMTLDPALRYSATLDTTCGSIELDLQAERSPLAVNNFVFLARQGYYDDCPVHRVVPGFVGAGR